MSEQICYYSFQEDGNEPFFTWFINVKVSGGVCIISAAVVVDNGAAADAAFVFYL